MVILIVGDKIDEGGFGAVFYARLDNLLCAAKAFFVTKTEYAQESIQKEIRILRRLRHRNIVQFYDVHHHKGRMYVVTELAERGSLSLAIQKNTLGCDWPTKIRLAYEMLRGLDYVHSEGVLHLDLKSSNVLLTKHMEVRLCDFGLARTSTISTIKSKNRRGTFRWGAPEIFSMEPEYSKKSDMYSFGMVLWAMAANSNIPFSHVKNDTEASKLIMEGQRCEIPKETPPEFRSWIERCWQHLPKERPTTGELLKEMADAYPQLTTHKSPLTNDAVSIPNVNIESVKHALKPTSPMAFDSPLPDKPFSDTTMPHHSGSSSESRVAMSAAAATSDRNSQSDKDFSSLMERARNHDVDALMSLALLYETGDGVLASESSAVFFYGRAAEQGHAPALFYLAGWFQNGHGSISQDKTRALKYYQAAAGKGHPEAQATLGHLYLKGSDTVTPDYALALDWFRKAASNEHADAAFNVGRMIANGQGADRDDVMAYICYRIAAQKGHADAMFALGEMCRHRQGVIQDKDGDIGWFRLAAEQGHPLAREEVDKMSKTSQAIQLSDTGASSHRSSPHVSDVPMAADEDPSFYESIGVSSGNGLAWDLLQKDDSDDPEAQFMIGKLLEEAAEKFQEDSRDKKQRYSEAFKWYHKAAEQGHADAQRTVARMYKEGRGVRKDDDEVMIWLTSAADGGDMKAQVELGSMYWFGQIVAQNDKVAASWLRKAAEQGDADAQWMLSMMNRTDGALKRDGEQIVE